MTPLRIGRWQLSLEGLALLAAVALGAGWLGSCGARGDGARAAQLEQLRAENDSLRQIRRGLDTVYRADTVRLWRTKERWDTAFVDVERWKHDTVEVVRYVALADSTIRACTAALSTCELRAGLLGSENRNLRRQVRLLEQGAARAWTAAGLSYDPGSGDVGAWVERDLWRFRAGLGVTPGRDGIRAELRGGWRW